jgi:hypothetical protein
MRGPLLAQIDGHVDIVQHAFLALQFPQDATLQKARGNGLQLAPSLKTSVRVHRKRR